jgi:hypothetical protein
MAINKKDHFSKVEDIQSKLKLNDLNSLESVVSNTKMRLHKELDSNFLFVEDKDTVKKIDHIVTKLGTGT